MLCSSEVQAKVNPGVEVYAQLPRPEGVREGCMPYAAWKYMRQAFTSSIGMCLSKLVFISCERFSKMTIIRHALQPLSLFILVYIIL